MKARHLISALAVGLLVALVPATVSASPVTRTDKARATRACISLRASLGADFVATYHTFGGCVSTWTRTAHAARHTASARCAAKLHGKSKRVIARCTSATTQSIVNAKVAATKNAAKQCAAERTDIGVAAFNAKYGRNENDANAFGKCVSAIASGKGQIERTVNYRARLAALNGSGASAVVALKLKGDQLSVRVDAAGVEPAKEHMQHVHGLASGNATCPTAAQADANHDGLITFAEGLPFYGAVLVPLTPSPTANASGAYTFEGTFTVNRSQLLPLEDRTVVIHGKTVAGSYDASVPVACGEIEKLGS